MKLNSIAVEAAACRKAFKGSKIADAVLHCHHKVLYELLTEPAENRINFILSMKPEHERALRLHLFRPVSKSKITSLTRKHSAIKKAYADWQKAFADRRKADADWQKADADRRKADADWQKAFADWQKADADWQKAYADRQKVYADWQKADADWQKADADWQKAHADLGALIHPHVCKNCVWNGKTIFPK